jgi:hypothetical protein
MPTLQEVLLLLGIIADIGITIIAIFEMIGDYRQNIDIFRVHKKMFNYLRNKKELNLFGTLLPIIIATPFLIDAMWVTLVLIIGIFIKNVIVDAYCKMFKRKDV